MELILADFIDDGRELHRDAALVIDRDGQIAAIGPAAELRAEYEGKVLISDWSGHILAPGCVNAHSHSFQVLMRGAADHPRDFADWVSSHLYPTVQRLDDRGIEIAALLCFAQMARAGVTTVGEFHYLHNGADGPGGTRIDRLVLDAARRVGLRVGFARCLYDSARKPGQERFAESVDAAREATLELAEAYRDDPLVRVLPAPHSLHGASQPMIELGIALAAELGTPYHIHLAEQQGDIAFAAERYDGARPLQVLERLGGLGSQLAVVHGIWLDEAERAQLAEAGGMLISNPTTNMYLGDGVADIPDLLRKGVRVALGTDANMTLSIFAEMRALEYLQRIRALEMGITARIPGAGGARILLRSGREVGGQALGFEVGRLAVGWPADLIAIDRHHPSLLPAAITGGEALVSALVTSMVPEAAIRHVLVQGQRVVSHGELATFSNEELSALVAETL